MVTYYYKDTLVKDSTQYLKNHYGLSKKSISEISKNITLVETQLTVNNLESRLKWIESIYIKDSILIVDNSTEALPLPVLSRLNDWCREREIVHVVITSAIDGNTLYSELFHPIFFRYEPLQQTDILNRKKKYTCLARLVNGREHRLLVVQELHRLGITEHGIISCGSGNTNEEIEYFKSIQSLDSKFRALLPITFETHTVSRTQGSVSNLEGIELSQYNLIIESSYEHFNSKETDLTYNHGWTRLFFTEKTAKCINSFQIPIWVAPQGFVEKMRRLKFDVFDDIVDHSYDEVLDPEDRIKAITREVQRLCEFEINNPDLNNRLLHNSYVLKELGIKYKEEFKQSLLEKIIYSL